MFSYYGSKSKIVGLYPPPIKDTIIEPFAGSARYALKYWDRNVVISDTFPKVYMIWKYLQRCSKGDILGLPNIGYKEKIPATLCDEERWLIGFSVGRGVPRPCTKGHKFNSWDTDKVRIANNLHKIKHWDIRNDDYSEIENCSATWFVDPPYEKMGYKYSKSKINYKDLGRWCIIRKGQTIVCENIDAKWMDFNPILSVRGAFKKNTEAIWTNLPTSFGSKQQNLF